jgi:hypothetical protein
MSMILVFTGKWNRQYRVPKDLACSIPCAMGCGWHVVEREVSPMGQDKPRTEDQ